jgi:subtilisin family serine protease
MRLNKTLGVTALGLTMLVSSVALADSFLVRAKGNLSQVANQVKANGGTVTHYFDQIGYLAVEADASFMEAKIAGFVMPDLELQWQNPLNAEGVVTLDEFGTPPSSGDDDFFFDLQWGHDAVNAPEAWNAGVRGNGVTVAVIDGGFDIDHPDLSPNIVDAVSFVPGEGVEYALPDTFSHGSHTAGTIGAADNAFGTIGVAPEVDLMLIKSLTDEGSGAFSWIIEGILYAADNDADVISMSLGASIPRRCVFEEEVEEGVFEEVKYPSVACAELLTATQAAISYAYQSGATVVASIGNDARDLDHDADLIEIPGQGPHHLGISATGPFGWGADPTTSLDWLAIYSNYGKSAVDFAAPGGDYYLAFFDEGYLPCTVAGLTRPCYVFDYVFSTGNDGWYWSVGTSMAAPHAAGIAALIVSENGGDMHPAQVMREMRARADDLGKPGKDDYYGNGRVSSGY